jgi:hypothetical protein
VAAHVVNLLWNGLKDLQPEPQRLTPPPTRAPSPTSPPPLRVAESPEAEPPASASSP